MDLYSVYKDKSPERTVFEIQQVLNKMDIGVIESHWSETDKTLISCRLVIEGTNIGSNGKGINHTYSLASAYAELMERIQTSMLFVNAEFSDDDKSSFGFTHDPNEVVYSNVETPLLPKSFENSYMFLSGLSTYDYWKKKLKNNKSKEHIHLPFFDINKNIDILLPYSVVFMMNGSNALCAGNTKEEALIQGMSEILERYVQRKIYLGQLSVPEISRDYLKNSFPREYKMIRELEEKHNYKVVVKDCTFSNKYPVVSILITNLKCEYAVCFGADPDIRIALQRCITEVFQGDSELLFKSKKDKVLGSMTDIVEYNNQLRTSSGKWSHNFFRSTSRTKPLIKEFSTMKNKYQYTLKLVNEIGCDSVYVRDCSFSTLKSYQIVIPGFTEAFIHPPERELSYSITLNEIKTKLMNINTQEHARVLTELQTRYKYEVIDSLWPINKHLQYKFDESVEISWEYVISMLCCSLKNYSEAILWLDKYIEDSDVLESIISCLRMIIIMKKENLSASHIDRTLENIYSSSIIQEASNVISDPIRSFEILTNNSSTKILSESYVKFKEYQQLSTLDKGMRVAR